MIEKVLRRHDKREVEPLPYLEPLEQRQILPVVPGSLQDVGAAVAVPPRRRRHKAGRIEPPVAAALARRKVAVADSVGPAAGSVGIGWIGAGKRRREEVAAFEI